MSFFTVPPPIKASLHCSWQVAVYSLFRCFCLWFEGGCRKKKRDKHTQFLCCHTKGCKVPGLRNPLIRSDRIADRNVVYLSILQRFGPSKEDTLMCFIAFIVFCWKGWAGPFKISCHTRWRMLLLCLFGTLDGGLPFQVIIQHTACCLFSKVRFRLMKELYAFVPSTYIQLCIFRCAPNVPTMHLDRGPKVRDATMQPTGSLQMLGSAGSITFYIRTRTVEGPRGPLLDHGPWRGCLEVGSIPG